MNLESNQNGEITVAKLCETRLDAAMSVRFKERMRELSDGGANYIVLDLSDVTFMDSSGLGAVVAVMKHMGREKTFKIAGLTPTVDKVFRLTRMDGVFDILDSVNDAFGAPSAATG